jgi:hypothetical protein
LRCSSTSRWLRAPSTKTLGCRSSAATHPTRMNWCVVARRRRRPGLDAALPVSASGQRSFAHACVASMLVHTPLADARCCPEPSHAEVVAIPTSSCACAVPLELGITDGMCKCRAPAVGWTCKQLFSWIRSATFLWCSKSQAAHGRCGYQVRFAAEALCNWPSNTGSQATPNSCLYVGSRPPKLPQARCCARSMHPARHGSR